MSFIFGRSRAPPAGWLVSPGGELLPDVTVAGHLARGREVRGTCHQRDCRRSCHLDLERLAARGLGAALVGELKALFRCHRMDGCALEFSERHGVELTLSVLAGRDYVAVRFACGRCRKATAVPAEAVIRKLEAEGTGGPDTPVSTLAGLARQPCRKCQARRWQVAVLWNDPEAAPTWTGRQTRRPPG